MCSHILAAVFDVTDNFVSMWQLPSYMVSGFAHNFLQNMLVHDLQARIHTMQTSQMKNTFY